MRFSLFFFTGKWAEGPGDHYRLLREAARFADQNGFEAVWTPERHFTPFGGLYANPAVAGAALATLTQRIGIRAGSVVLPMRNPIRVAEEWSMVDILSQGRVGVSFASGWHVNDFVLKPENYERRREVMHERIDQVQRLWRGESIHIPNGAGIDTEIRIFPKPFQAAIPIWLTAQSESTFIRAGKMGANLLTNMNYQSLDSLEQRIATYRKHFAESGAPGRGHVSLMVHTFVGPKKDIETKAKPAYAEYLLTNLDLQSAKAKGLGITVDATEEDKRFLVSRAVDRMIGKVGLIGTPDQCQQQSQYFQKLDVDEVACLIDFGVDDDSVLAGLPHLAAIQSQL